MELEWRRYAYILCVPIFATILMIAKMILRPGSRPPMSLGLKGMGVELTIRSGCIHFDPSRVSGCNIMGDRRTDNDVNETGS